VQRVEAGRPEIGRIAGTVRAVQAGPVIGLIAQALLLAVLAGTVGLSGAGWVVGVTCGVIASAALARGLSRYGSDRLGPADWVTLSRATLAIGVAGLVADSFDHPARVTMLVTLATVALALDAVDGWVVRRTGTASKLGALFDGEVDAFLITVLSVYVARSAGVWVLAIGAARYGFLAAGWLAPWMREQLPPRYWRKVVAATQGIVLTVAAADVLPLALNRAALIVALALLAESFGHDVAWLWVRRHATYSRLAAVADGNLGRAVATQAVPRGRVRTSIAALLTVLALLVVWAALVAPDHLSRLTPSAFVRLPLEGLVVVALALVLPPTTRRLLACVVGPVLGLLVIVKVLDMGFFEAFDRPFDPVADGSYTGIGIETLRDSIGRTEANLVVAGAAVLGVALLVLTTLAVLRLTRVAAGHRRWSLPAVTALAVVWVLCWGFGARFVSYAPIASTSAAGLVSHEVRAVQAGVQDHAIFGDEIRHDRFRGTPADQLLTGLRGKDVLLVFVESYGKVAIQNPAFSPRVVAVLDKGTKRLQAAGFSSRSAFLTSSTFGGLSWLAHSTMQSGVWVDNQLRYDQLVDTDRLTLSGAFKRAGWRTVGDVPSNNRTWPQGTSFYHYDKLYDRRNVGYRGPKFSYASMPDQYVLLALQRLELAKRNRPPIFAEVDLVSSHTPWNRIPRMIGWNDVGDGSVFKQMPVDQLTRAELFGDLQRVRAAYAQSIAYTMNALVSFVQHYGDDNLVLVVLGDHQPSKIITGENPSHDVPISVIAHDPAVMQRIAGWGWQDGLRPSPAAPIWRMDAFRNRFLSAYGS
jgi:phosphatidylglycerophosphate synthase